MKLCLYFLIVILLCPIISHSQDIPLFSQKLTGSFIYNPSLAGTDGSVTIAHRTNFSNVVGSGNMNYLRFNIPVVDKNFGVGLNVFNEKINFLSNTFISAAFAYHINLGNNQLISMGVSGEYDNLKPDYDKVVGDVSDEMLAILDESGYNKMDFSTGINYQNRYFKIGVGINRLATAFGSENKKNILSQYFTAQISGLLPVRAGNDLFEPTFTYRKYSRIGRILDLGAYYTYANLIMIGGSVRMGSSNDFSSVKNAGVDIINFTAGFRIMEKLLIGYSRDIITKSAGRLGVGNEITLRYNFLENNYRENSRSTPQYYKGKQKNHKRRRPGKFRRRTYNEINV